jgi:WD40 repeat protein
MGPYIDPNLGNDGKQLKAHFKKPDEIAKHLSWVQSSSSTKLGFPINDLAFSPDGNNVWAACDDKKTVRYGLDSKKVEQTLTGATDVVKAVSVSKSTSLMATGSTDGSVLIYKDRQSNPTKTMGAPKPGDFFASMSVLPVWDVLLIPNSDFVLASGSSILRKTFQIVLWNHATATKEFAFEGHTGALREIALLPGNKQFVSAACDGSIKLWDIEKRQFVRDIVTGLGEQYTVDISPDGKWVAGAGADRMTRVWEIATGKKVLEFAGHLGEITKVLFFPDGKKLLTAGYDKKAIVWSLETQKPLVKYTDFASPVFAVAISPDGEKLAFGTQGGDLKIEFFEIPVAPAAKEKIDPKIQPREIAGTDIPFSNINRPPMLVFEKGMHTAEMSEVKFHPNGREFVTASRDKTIRIWSADNGQLLRTIRVPSGTGAEGQIFTMDISPDGNFLVAAGSSLGQQFNKLTADYIGDYVLLIDYKTGNILDVSAKHKQSIFGVRISSDGNWVVSGGGTVDNRLVLYKLNKTAGKLEFVREQDIAEISKNYVPTCEANPKSKAGICSNQITRVGWIPGTNEALCADENGMLLKFTNNLQEPKLLGESAMRKMAAFMGKFSGREMIRSLAVDPLGRFVAIGDLAGITTFFDTKGNPTPTSGKSYEKLLGNIPAFNQRAVFALAISPKGDKIAVASHNKIQVYDLKIGTDGKVQTTHISSFDKNSDAVLAMTFSPDGSRIISAGEKPAESYCWEVSTGKVLFDLVGDKKADIISAVGAHKSNPMLIGFGKTLDASQTVNNSGKITHAFDLSSFSLLEKVNIADFETAADRVAKFKTPQPDLKFITYTEPVYSYMPLDDDNVLIGGAYSLYFNSVHSPIFNSGSTVTGMAMSKDGRTVFASFQNGTIQLYDTDGMKLVATLYVSSGNEWLIWTPDGYYAASKYGAQSVAWLMVSGAAKTPGFFPFEQFDLRLNRPDIVLSRIGGVSKDMVSALNEAYKKRLRKMGIDESKLTSDMVAPTLSVDLENRDFATKNITFNVKAESTTSPFQALMVYVSDVPVYGAKGLPLSGNRQLNQTVSLELSTGRNKIQVSVLNAQGVESLKETRYVNYTGVSGKPDLHIVTIGVSKYVDQSYNLTYAAKDADDVVNTFKSKSGDYGKVNVLTFNDSKAIREQIADAKTQLKNSKVDDMVILFVAAHGLRDSKSDYYIATHDVNFENPAARGLGYDRLEELLDGIPARKKLLLIDACNSGELDEDDTRTQAGFQSPTGLAGNVSSRGFTSKKAKEQASKTSPMGIGQTNDVLKELFNDLRRGTGAMVISSAGGAEFAFESSEWKNGVFTFSLLEGIRTGKADSNKDGEIRVSELRDYVFERVKHLTAGKQNPTSRQENLEFDFRVW